jgi:hypothetical protein
METSISFIDYQRFPEIGGRLVHHGLPDVLHLLGEFPVLADLLETLCKVLNDFRRRSLGSGHALDRACGWTAASAAPSASMVLIQWSSSPTPKAA